MRNWRKGNPIVVAAALLLMAGTVAGQTVVPKQKHIVPLATELKDSITLVMSVYGQDIAAAKTAEQKVGVVKKLVMAAKEEKDISAKYVLFAKARELAISAGDGSATCQVISDTGAVFDINISKQNVEALTTISKSLTSNDIREKYIVTVCIAIEVAVKADDFESARALSVLQVTVARATASDAKLKDATALAADIRDTEAAYLEFKKGSAILETAPTNAEASVKFGKYLCFYKNEWDKGLPALAQGNNAVYKQAAEDDVKAPTAPDDKVKLADEWWSISITLSGRAKLYVQIRAGRSYEAAAGAMPAGLARTRIEKRVIDIRVSLAEKYATIGKDANVAPTKETVVGKWEVGISFGGTGPVGVITLNADRSASNSWRVVDGTWEIVDNEVRITWKDGWTDVLRVKGGVVNKYGYKPGTTISDTAFDVYKATKQK